MNFYIHFFHTVLIITFFSLLQFLPDPSNFRVFFFKNLSLLKTKTLAFLPTICSLSLKKHKQPQTNTTNIQKGKSKQTWGIYPPHSRAAPCPGAVGQQQTNFPFVWACGLLCFVLTLFCHSFQGIWTEVAISPSKN